jgi:hypothetical protein
LVQRQLESPVVNQQVVAICAPMVAYFCVDAIVDSAACHDASSDADEVH